MAIDWDAHVLAPTMKVFGETVTYTPAGSGAFQITDAVFDPAYREVEPLSDDIAEITSTPALGVRLASFPAGVTPGQGDTVSIPSVGKTFVVRDPRPDGHGHARLLLNFVSEP